MGTDEEYLPGGAGMGSFMRSTRICDKELQGRFSGVQTLIIGGFSNGSPSIAAGSLLCFAEETGETMPKRSQRRSAGMCALGR